MDTHGDMHLDPMALPAEGPFVGQFLHALDPKKRLTIPSEWRELVGLPQRLYIVKGLRDEQCLYVLPDRVFKGMFAKISKLSDDKGRQYARILGANSQMVTWDAQGRIRVNDDMLAFAGIGEQVQLVGSLYRMEMWSHEVWSRTLAASTLTSAGGGITLADAFEYLENTP